MNDAEGVRLGDGIARLDDVFGDDRNGERALLLNDAGEVRSVGEILRQVFDGGGK